MDFMQISKITVHNAFEGRTLIEEAYSRGEEEKFQGTKFYTHDGKFLFESTIRLVEYTLTDEDGCSTTREL